MSARSSRCTRSRSARSQSSSHRPSVLFVPQLSISLRLRGRFSCANLGDLGDGTNTIDLPLECNDILASFRAWCYTADKVMLISGNESNHRLVDLYMLGSRIGSGQLKRRVMRRFRENYHAHHEHHMLLLDIHSKVQSADAGERNVLAELAVDLCKSVAKKQHRRKGQRHIVVNHLICLCIHATLLKVDLVMDVALDMLREKICGIEYMPMPRQL